VLGECVLFQRLSALKAVTIYPFRKSLSGHKATAHKSDTGQ